MSISDLAKQEEQLKIKTEQLKKLQEKINAEKRKINERVGKAVIEILKLDYGNIDDSKIEDIKNIVRGDNGQSV